MQRFCSSAELAAAGTEEATRDAEHRKPCSLCPHQRISSQCKQCGGLEPCHHQRYRNQCKDCGGARFCLHQRRRNQCKECGAVSICPHLRERSQCKECGCWIWKACQSSRGPSGLCICRDGAPLCLQHAAPSSPSEKLACRARSRLRRRQLSARGGRGLRWSRTDAPFGWCLPTGLPAI